MDNDLMSLVRELATNLQLRLSELTVIEELKLAPFQARLLSVIGHNPGISQLALAASTDRDKAQVARAIKVLEARGFIVRSAHVSDWRTQCLDVTAEGRQASTRLDSKRSEYFAKAMRDCSVEEQDAAFRTLEKINRSIYRPLPTPKAKPLNA
jgi:DNA-binding MarR family transcriptional regulator